MMCPGCPDRMFGLGLVTRFVNGGKQPEVGVKRIGQCLQEQGLRNPVMHKH